MVGGGAEDIKGVHQYFFCLEGGPDKKLDSEGATKNTQSKLIKFAHSFRNE